MPCKVPVIDLKSFYYRAGGGVPHTWVERFSVHGSGLNDLTGCNKRKALCSVQRQRFTQWVKVTNPRHTSVAMNKLRISGNYKL